MLAYAHDVRATFHWLPLVYFFSRRSFSNIIVGSSFVQKFISYMYFYHFLVKVFWFEWLISLSMIIIQSLLLLTSSSSSPPPFVISEVACHIYPETSKEYFAIPQCFNLSQPKILTDLHCIFYRVCRFSDSALGFYPGRGGTWFKSLPHLRLFRVVFLCFLSRMSSVIPWNTPRPLLIPNSTYSPFTIVVSSYLTVSSYCS
jgi:hypothetical protein